MPEIGPNWARELNFPTTPDLNDVLGDTDFDFENLHLLDFLGIPDFWISRFLDSQIQGCRLVAFGRGGSAFQRRHITTRSYSVES